MLTRQLYRVDEVRAALLWCILKARVIETAFWATELAESGEDFAKELLMAWTYGIGVAGLGFIPLLESDPVPLAIALSRWPRRDASVVAILGSVADRVGMPDLPPGTWTPEETYALRAMMQGKAGSAFAARASWGEAWSAAMQFKHGRQVALPSLEVAALQTAIVCQRTLDFKEPPLEIPKEVAEAMAEWEAEMNLRRRRVYAIPEGCLSILTARGALDSYTSTDSELTDTRKLEGALAASSLWADAITEARASDTGREEFYESYFCDIPDEWSAADRAKSHGFGLNPCDQARFITRWFGTMPCCAIWNGIATAVPNGRGFRFKPPTNHLDLRPVKRIVVPC
jgi:hypothetical protein